MPTSYCRCEPYVLSSMPCKRAAPRAISLLYVHLATNQDTHCMRVCPTAPRIPSHASLASLREKRGSWGLGVRPQCLNRKELVQKKGLTQEI